MNLLIKTVTSEDSVTPLILRITFAIVLWPYGAQLLLGMFGGNCYTGSMGYFATLGLSYFVSFLVIFLLFFGGIFIYFTRFFYELAWQSKRGRDEISSPADWNCDRIADHRIWQIEPRQNL